MRTSSQQPGNVVESLVFGFGISVGMWFVGYLGRLPGVEARSGVIGAFLLVTIFVGGIAAGRFGSRGARGAAIAGLIASAINLLVLGSLLADRDPERVRVTAALWIPGFSLATALLAWGGGLAGRPLRKTDEPQRDWPFLFAVVTAFATILLLLVGGVVTTHRAGLAVVDWPNSFGSNMFLFPLSRMTGGVYYEHAHRLFGSLVGLTTVFLAVAVHLSDRRGWVRRLSLLAVCAVIFQGVLGGLRVTGHFTAATDPSLTAPNVTLAVVHGVLAQAFFGLLVAMAVFLSKSFRSQAPPAFHRGASGGQGLATLLVGAILVQVVLGAWQRHLDRGLAIHVSMATVVVVLALAAGARAIGLQSSLAPVRKTGIVLSVLIGLQVLLGVAAAAAIVGKVPLTQPAAWQVLIRAAHQGTGALLLATAVTLAIWSRRLVTPEVRNGE